MSDHPFDYTEGEKIERENCIVIKVNPGVYFPEYCCGYIYFNINSVPESWWGEIYLDESKPCADIFNDIDVPGGITFAVRYENILVYGFDRAHVFDIHNTKSGDMGDTLRLTIQFRDSFLDAIKTCMHTRNIRPSDVENDYDSQ